MGETDAILRSLAEEIQALRQHVAEQQQVISQHQAELAQLRTQIERVNPKNQAALSEAASGESPQRYATGRRRLLASAGTAAAAAVTTAVVLGAAENVAHAASGNDWILGQGNNADATTYLFPTAGATPSPLLYAWNVNTSEGIGIQGYGGPGGNGVYGNATHPTGYGVWGESDTGFGVVGGSIFGVDVAALGTGRLQQSTQASAWPPSSGSYSIGEMIRDANGDLWICIATGSPGTWARIPHVVPGSTGGAITYLFKPIRLLDSRSGSTDAFIVGGGPYGGGSIHTLDIAGVFYNGVTVPSTALGAIGNVTVVSASSGSGFLALVPSGAGFSGTAVLSYNSAQIVSNSFNVGLTNGKLDIIVEGNSTDVILDLFAVVA
jgi:hypothetical protein